MTGTDSLRSRPAFTLLELLIVVSIVAILIALLIPALGRARQQAYQVACAANLNTIFKGMFYYSEDPNNGNGYLPQLGTHSMPFSYWTGQICSYIKIKRSKLGSRNGLFHCPAHESPQLRRICGPKAGIEATAQEKLTSDTGHSSGTMRRGRQNTESSIRNLGDLIEPVSYTGSCDFAESRVVPGAGAGAGAHPVNHPRKWSMIERPHCLPMLTETNQDSGRTARCFRFADMLGEAKTHPDYRRHYGGTSPFSNGSNFLFGDGHVSWHPANFSAGKLICCVDFGFRSNQILSANSSYTARAEELRREHCRIKGTTRGRRGR